MSFYEEPQSLLNTREQWDEAEKNAIRSLNQGLTEPEFAQAFHDGYSPELGKQMAEAIKAKDLLRLGQLVERVVFKGQEEAEFERLS